MPKYLNLPLITVVTVVRNGVETINETMLSVLNQSYPRLEYILVDGGSTDGTLDVIRQYESNISKLVTEQDSGIYDAMNKGVNLAEGEWINFMNSGDVFYDMDVLMKLFGDGGGDSDVIYGNALIQYPIFSRIEHAGTPNHLWAGMQFSHQSAFVRLRHHKQFPFDKYNKIAADLDFFYTAFKNGLIFGRTHVTIAIVRSGGLSDLNRINSILSSCRAICGNQLRPFIRLYYYGRVINSILRSIIKFFLPSFIVNKIILFKIK